MITNYNGPETEVHTVSSR